MSKELEEKSNKIILLENRIEELEKEFEAKLEKQIDNSNRLYKLVLKILNACVEEELLTDEQFSSIFSTFDSKFI